MFALETAQLFRKTLEIADEMKNPKANSELVLDDHQTYVANFGPKGYERLKLLKDMLLEALVKAAIIWFLGGLGLADLASS